MLKICEFKIILYISLVIIIEQINYIRILIYVLNVIYSVFSISIKLNMEYAFLGVPPKAGLFSIARFPLTENRQEQQHFLER